MQHFAILCSVRISGSYVRAHELGPPNQRSDKSNLGVVAGLLGHALEAREELQVLLRHCYHGFRV